MPFRDAETLGEELASYGPRVTVISPPELAGAVRRRLTAAADVRRQARCRTWPSRRPGRAGRTRKRTSEDQLKRMLQLVPFLVHNQGLHISEVAARFGITRKALEDDLRILICSGLPEGYPDDLLDIQWDDDHVFITQALDLTRPVRFTVDEACALLTGLETLNSLPELAEGGALESVTLKLMAAAGEEGVKAAALSGPEVAPGDSATLDTARAALRIRRAAAPEVLLAAARRRVRTRRGPLAALFAGQHVVPRGVLPLRPGPAQLPAGQDRSP